MGAAAARQIPFQEVVTRARDERRRFRRVVTELKGRFLLVADAREAACTVGDMSAGGASVITDEAVPEGARVVLYVDGLGRFEGHSIRSDESGFSMSFVCSANKRERTAEFLTVHINRALVGDAEIRRHDRGPGQGFTRFTRASGEQVRCEVVDLSLSGVSLRTHIAPPIGEHVLIGHMAGRVVRHLTDGIAIQFLGVPSGSPAPAIDTAAG